MPGSHKEIAQTLVVTGKTVATPQAVGRWRLRATFNGTDVSAPGRSDYRELDVASVLTPET